MGLNSNEKKDLKDSALSESLRQDMEAIAKSRHDPFNSEGKVNVDKLIDFLTIFNEFSNNSGYSFRRIIDSNMKL